MKVQRVNTKTPYVVPFKRASRVLAAFGEHRAAVDAVDAQMECAFQVPFVILPGVGDVIVLGQMTLRGKF